MTLKVATLINFVYPSVKQNTSSFLFFNSIRTLSTNVAENSQKTIKVAVIGVPNAGKSTFINNLINHRVCPTSSKVHTTRKAHKAIFTTNNVQVILYDTPGLVTEREMKKHHLERSFSSAYRHSIQRANLITVIHDVSNTFTRHELHATVLDSLKAYPKLPSILILNKIDALKSKRVLLDLVPKLTNNKISLKRKNKIHIREETKECEDTNQSSGWSNFFEVFMVSSITGNGLQDVLHYILNQAYPSNWEHSPDVFTDDSPEDIIVNSVKARLLDYLPQEIPYNLISELEYYNVLKNVIYASVQVTCPSARIERLICGESNGKLKQITERITSDLVETFGKPVSLTIATTVQKSAEVQA